MENSEIIYINIKIQLMNYIMDQKSFAAEEMALIMIITSLVN